MHIQMPEIDDIMTEIDLGRMAALDFYRWYDELPPSKRGDWRDRVRDWRVSYESRLPGA